MNDREASGQERARPKLAMLPLPAKAFIVMVILTMAIAMIGALGQIVVHDIIPTFYPEKEMEAHFAHERESPSLPGMMETIEERGDLFTAEPLEEKPAEPFYKTEHFVWTLKWTHIHLFGMNMIFIFMGAITFFLDLSARTRTWLIVLPFVGVLIDIAGVWFRGYISPAFFWLHIPGGGLFAAIFVFVSLRALWEMWQSDTVR